MTGLTDAKNSILVVDDEAMSISAFIHILGQDYNVYAEKDGKGCLEAAKMLRPDLILLDVIMPQISGFDVIKILKNDADVKDIPVIFVTGKNTPEDEVKGFSLGAVDYINKPFSAAIVKTRIQHQMQIINQKRKLESLQKAEEIERQKNEQARINKRVQLIIESSPMSIELYNTSGVMLDCSEGTLIMHGYDDKDKFIKAYNESPETFYPQLQPCGTPSSILMAKYLEEAANNESAQFEWTHRTCKGEDFPTEVKLVHIESDDAVMLVAHVHDLRELKRLEDERLYAVEEGSRAKSRFLAHMSHEIRTPITAIMGISEVLLRGQSMSPVTEEAFVKIYDSSKMLLTIVNDILDLSRIESGKMELNCDQYDFAYLINDVPQLHLTHLEYKEVSFNMSIDKNIPAKFFGDSLRIKQIINNLLANAFKYTEHGTVTMSVKCEQGEDDNVTLDITIDDTGKGMSSEQVDEVKKEYVRINDKNYRIAGVGLGIPIVCSLVKMMGAHLDIQSELGKGTHVNVRIPQRVLGDEILGSELAHSLQNFEQLARSSHKELAFIPEQMPHGTILVVDDVETNLHVVDAMLEAFGITAELVGSGEAAIEKITQGNVYDIIFMDYMMPGMDGIETANKARSMGYNQPIVALTANAIKGQAEMFMENGFSGFMSKPIDIKILNSYLVKFIKEQTTD